MSVPWKVAKGEPEPASVTALRTRAGLAEKRVGELERIICHAFEIESVDDDTLESLLAWVEDS